MKYVLTNEQRKFLVDKGLLTVWSNEQLDFNIMEGEARGQFIMFTIHWKNTPQGQDFWCDLHIEAINYFKESL